MFACSVVQLSTGDKLLLNMTNDADSHFCHFNNQQGQVGSSSRSILLVCMYIRKCKIIKNGNRIVWIHGKAAIVWADIFIPLRCWKHVFFSILRTWCKCRDDNLFFLGVENMRVFHSFTLFESLNCLLLLPLFLIFFLLLLRHKEKSFIF